MLPDFPANTAVLFRRLEADEPLAVGRDYLFRVQRSRWKFIDTFKRLRRITRDGNLIVVNANRDVIAGRARLIPRADVFWIGEPIEVRKWEKIGGDHA